MSTSSVPFNQVINVPAYGFLRGLWFNLVASGGVAGTYTALDGPWNALSLTFQDVSGNPFIGPVPAGFFLSSLMKYGGYRYSMDPRVMASGTVPNFTVWYFVPVEIIKRSGLGSITNLNAAASYQIYATLAPATTIFSANPTTFPSVTLTVYQECWSQPPAQDVLGNLTTRQPPNLNTTQFWTLQSYAVAGSGYQIIKLLRVGYYLRNLMLYMTTSAGVRSDSPTPPQLELWKDNQQLWIQLTTLLRQKIYNDFGYSPNTLDAAGGQDTGIYPIIFDNDFGLLPGNELRNGYLPTLQSTKLEIRGTFGAAATMYVVTNDVAPPEGAPGSIFFPSTL
jgi:hypothetical protein